jgi:O-glycosyl hydrolase
MLEWFKKYEMPLFMAMMFTVMSAGWLIPSWWMAEQKHEMRRSEVCEAKCKSGNLLSAFSRSGKFTVDATTINGAMGYVCTCTPSMDQHIVY